jgi:5-formyltetrahydrofolate cyclo-ligase
MTKKELREKYKLLREELDQTSVDVLSKACFSIFFKNFHFQGKNIGIFLPITSKKEPNTFLLFSEFSTENINYYAPKIDELSDEMKFYSISNSDQIEFGLYKIPEPVTGKKIEFSALEIILIPLLCFDAEGNRVGYGKGYYDKLLENSPKDLLKIGVSLFNDPEQIDDINSNDIALDFCITPLQLIKFSCER